MTKTYSFISKVILLFLTCELLHGLSTQRRFIFRAPKAVRDCDVAVIGGGVGGLISSTLLSEKGKRVTLLEKNIAVGGRCNSEEMLTSDGHCYRFDIGPSLLLLPEVYRSTFRSMGSNLEDHLDLIPVDPLYRCFFDDGDIVDISRDSACMKQTVLRVERDEGGFDAYQKYMRIAKTFLAFGLPNVIEEKFTSSYLIEFLSACIRNIPFLSHRSMLEKYFKTEKMRAAMSFQDLYIGLSPYEAPSIFSLLQALEISNGIYYPRGGFGKLSSALEDIAIKSGVHIVRNSSLVSVDVNHDDDTIVSVSYEKEKETFHLQPKVLITNVDAPQFESQFIPAAKGDQRCVEGRPSCGVVSLSFAFNTTLNPLTHHSIFFSLNYKESWKTVENPDTSIFNTNAFNFYVHAPLRSDLSAAPEGHDAITVLVPVPPIRKQNTVTGTDDDLIEKVKRAVLNRLQRVPGMPERIEDYIVGEIYRSPSTWKQNFNLFRGSAFGLAHSLDQLSFLRPRLRHPKIRNLYRVGASTRPGNGVPLVMIGARLTAGKILRDFADGEQY